MKKITFLFALVAIATVANATVYLDEIFSYPDGALKNNAGWLSGGSTSWTSDYLVVDPALTYSNTGGTYVLSGQGKQMSCNYITPYGSSNYTVYRTFTETAISTGSVYVSFLYSPNGESQSQSQAPVMSLSATGTNTGVQVWVGKGVVNAANFRFGTTRGSTTSADIKWSATEYEDKNAVYLVVLKYDLDTQVASVFVNPVIGSLTEPVAEISDATSTANVRTSVQTIQFKTNGSSKEVYVAGSVRVSSTWAEAVAAQSTTAAPLIAPVVGAASSIGAESFTASWTAVANATGYTVNVYIGANLQGSYDATGQDVESLIIKGLLTNTVYTYTVVAKGDMLNFSNSPESTPSAVFTTLEGLTAISTIFNDGSWGTLFTSENQPAAAAFPSSYQNGFNLLHTFLYDISKYDSRGEYKENGLRMDRMSNGGMVVLPTVKSVEQIEIHAIPGGAPRSIILKELIDNNWTIIGSYEMTSSVEYKEFIIPLSRTTPTKLRIENAGSGQVTLYQVITRATNPVLLDTPVVGIATGVASTQFVANWAAVTNATAYKVKVYQGTTLLSTIDVPGQSSESVVVSGLDPETDYTYKVLAVGDNYVNYADSYLSAASEMVTTGITTSLNSTSELKVACVGKSVFASEAGKLEVFNLQGARVVEMQQVSNAALNLPGGLYVLQFTSNDGRKLTRKLILD